MEFGMEKIIKFSSKAIYYFWEAIFFKFKSIGANGGLYD